MNRSQLARNFAASLTLGAWSKEALCSTLERRLPPPLRDLARDISLMLITDVPRVYAPAPRLVQNALLLDDQFERVYQFCRKHSEWPAPDLSSPVMASVAAFADLDLPQLPTLAALADWLFLPLDRLEYLADVHNRYEKHG